MLAEGFFEQHISTVAAPVFGDNAQVVAAVGLTIPGSKISADKRTEYTALVRAAAAQLSTLLNHDQNAAQG